MEFGMRVARTACAAAGVLIIFFIASTRQAQAQGSATQLAKTASPELVGQLTKALSVTPAQASGGAGALFGLAKSRLSAADFGKVAACVPGISGLIKSAPSASPAEGASGLAGLESSLPGGLGGAASVAESFHKLGLSPEMAAKFVPVLTKFVQTKGGASTASLLENALKLHP
ncbi:MAG TPA: DUF2780 domain-containing protein [Terriglobia bacterium]|nr:DUF2780 domain-containing protein [Terriglobia bacterium]